MLKHTRAHIHRLYIYIHPQRDTSNHIKTNNILSLTHTHTQETETWQTLLSTRNKILSFCHKGRGTKRTLRYQQWTTMQSLNHNVYTKNNLEKKNAIYIYIYIYIWKKKG